LNRIDEVIVFHRLPEESLYRVVDKMLDEVRTRLAERQLTLELTEEARVWLVKNGYDETYGARPLRRLIQKEVENGLARRVLASELSDGDLIEVTVVDDRLTFKRVSAAGEEAEVTAVAEVSHQAA
jgi:ATP-dependent Clp protease ATP-binding subunit ClpA